MCIATRRKAPVTSLLRIVAQEIDGDFYAVPDAKKKAPGRGAWIEPTPESYAIATRKNAFGRALRVNGNIDTSAVREYIEEKRKTDH
ncbi:MAG: YlxR family protein [Corynebacterium sp.]|nr:YlxR family protein [Corynebacterium sp.]